ncbi:30S ribosomal protein S12 methylthiotransferase RimO [Thermophilibacter provencensis]|uniref:Ribosomal protein uS12 methylthiotransferase RimO n=1 Tax=Thermophilibacter provencensis TaxID=1852386 RepID=A0ABT7V349_9ACTN|nr:30S ribosomal protein S12 methylthiotransferase RimO [Thermophilibacter provencensis]MDM8271020.1 30S ribosomal protein S12 methylthiotransferase RimO [Thermophilibacter provencensis]
MQFLIVTLGCAKNEVDSDRMRALLLAAGFEETVEASEADVAIVNTCSFLASATEESVEATLQLAEERSTGVRECPIVMCGCVPSRYGDALAEELPEVSAFVRAEDEDGIVNVVCDVLGVDVPATPEEDAVPLRTVEGASAFVKISEGCDRFCTFCAIPYIRGRYHSRPADEIAAEVRDLMEGGVREVVLIGQDTGVWGCDLGEKDTLASLLRRVADVVRPYGGWVRVLYLQPEGMTDELVSTIRDVDEVLPYIDIPIQHCSARVLKAMGRSGSPEELHALFARLRSEIPGMVLRTTGMAGFPGETDEEAEELYDFIAEEEFDYCSVFAYSQEEGTRAASMPDQVDEAVKLERTQRLIDLTEQLGFAATASHVGERVRVIVDGIEEGDDGPELIGHAWFQAPDSDGAVHIAYGEAAVGDIVTVDLVDSFCYELIGEIVEEGL